MLSRMNLKDFLIFLRTHSRVDECEKDHQDIVCLFIALVVILFSLLLCHISNGLLIKWHIVLSLSLLLWLTAIWPAINFCAIFYFFFRKSSKRDNEEFLRRSQLPFSDCSSDFCIGLGSERPTTRVWRLRSARSTCQPSETTPPSATSTAATTTEKSRGTWDVNCHPNSPIRQRARYKWLI